MPEAPDVYQLMTLWGTAHKNLSEILDCEPDPKEDDEDMRQDIIAWCKKVAKTSVRAPLHRATTCALAHACFPRTSSTKYARPRSNKGSLCPRTQTSSPR
ncbi:hypothetical protein BOTBODRAFT_588017 [Botryobasidium botryosum FD-172 SS1]|uniref:Uncharacterized protein n=1 Tax=Botryobasidium botryosum (strain FD-172 SS1) TaxID=930990 RepID=A0A067M812_BOTB1|nr:hypothetical protein BOTBODRAFT_588017 [Botryobasidium botryosum FD-172 SS1]